jgi:glycosyltransferase involved in cell wall biosynthesis
MRIGIDIDILGLSNLYTGIPNYLRRLVDAFTRLEPGAVHFYLLTRRPVYRYGDLPSHVSQVVIRWPLGRGWQSVALPWAAWRLKLDLMHLPAFTVPFFAPCPVVVTVHDLAYLAYPEYCQDVTVSYLSRRLPIALKKTSAVITPSDFVKYESIQYFDLPPAKIYPVHHGVSSEFKVLPENALIKARKGLGLQEHFFLFVGTIEPRKNLTILIKAFERAIAQGLDYYLVLAGTKGWKCEDIYTLPRQLGLEHRVLFLDYVPDGLLPPLYNVATAFVYPSLYEGFGMPVLEAMACGTPVISSNTSSLPEVVGEAGILVDPLDINGLTSAMILLAKDAELRRGFTQKGLERAASFSWERTAKETIGVYEAALKSAKERNLSGK